MNAVHLVILKLLAQYYTLQRADLQPLCMPESDRQGRTLRRHLNTLLRPGLINQTRGEVSFQDRNGAPAPVYFPSKKGCEFRSRSRPKTADGAHRPCSRMARVTL